MKSGRQLTVSASSTASYVRVSKFVLSAATRCPPAEKPKHSDALRIQAPFGGAIAHHADGALRVLQRRPVPRQPRAHRHAILHQRAIDSEGIQPLADLRALQVHRQDVVAAAGKDDYGGAGVGGRGRAVHGQRGVAHQAQADHRLAGDQAIGGFGGVLFRAEASLVARRRSGPEGNRSKVSGGREDRGEEEHQAADFAHKFAVVQSNRVTQSAIDI